VVVFFATQGVGDLVKDRLLGVLERAQCREVNRQRDLLLVVVARSRPAPGVIPSEGPLMVQYRKVLRDEAFGESLNL
jgi:hypothetical protein